MENFFIYETELPDGIGFSAYGPVHLSFLAGILAAIFIILHFYNRSSRKTQRRIYLATASAALTMQVLMAVYFAAVGVNVIYSLPLHLCSLASYLAFLHAVFNWDILGQSLFYPLMPGACCALLFPDWTRYPVFSFMSLEGFLIHAAVILYVCMRLADSTIAASWNRIWKPVLFLVCWGIPVWIFDHVFFVNYGFLFEASYGSPLMGIQEKFGTTGYLAAYAGIIFGFMLLFYLAYGIIVRYRVRGKKPGQ
ncbi:MAG: YwaF family protein [Lachnospiraceae bacterium]|jgi:hypothetical integral membrane protein (TIGR02206 family)|nr:YwaF family protein [Lachnospiraceae bacterium]